MFKTLSLPVTNWLLIAAVALNFGFLLYFFGDVNLALPLVKLDPVIQQAVEMK